MKFLEFKTWLFTEESVKTVLGHNPKKPNDPNYDFLTVYNAKEIYQILKKNGFRFYKGDLSWSIPRFAFEKLSDLAKEELKRIGVNIDLFNQDRNSTIAQGAEQKAQIASSIEAEKAIQKQKAQEEEEIRRNTDYSDSKVNQLIKNQLLQIDQLINKNDHEKINKILDDILEEIGSLTDEAAKGEKIKNFLEMSSRLYHYSTRNQWLIFAQNPKATDVQSKTMWKKLGRILKPDAEKHAMLIYRPVNAKLKTIKVKEKNRITGEEEEVSKRVSIGRPTRFAIEYVYDIEDTILDPNAKSPYKPHSWREDSNEPIEELSGIIASIIKFADASNIPLKFEDLNYATGGYASKHGIVVNSKYEGINKATSLIHELAHKMMHFVEEKLNLSRAEAEHDAETVAYTVLKFFGFKSKDSPVYLSLWGANKEKIKIRAKGIKETVSKILRAIHEYYESK